VAQVAITGVPSLSLYQQPDGPIIGQIRPRQILTVLYGRQDVGGLIWVEVRDDEGRLGWIPSFYLNVVTITPSPN
jgi:hypothetical protein